MYMKKLIAKRDILYECKYYEKGEMLPTKEPNMVQAWIDCGSAEWQESAARSGERPEQPLSLASSTAPLTRGAEEEFNEVTQKGAEEEFNEVTQKGAEEVNPSVAVNRDSSPDEGSQGEVDKVKSSKGSQEGADELKPKKRRVKKNDV